MQGRQVRDCVGMKTCLRSEEDVFGLLLRSGPLRELRDNVHVYMEVTRPLNLKITPRRVGCSHHLHIQLETTRRQIPEGRKLGCRNRLPRRQPTSISYRQLCCKVEGWHSVIRNVGHSLCLYGPSASTRRRNVKAWSHSRVLTKLPSAVLVPEYSLSERTALHALVLVDKFRKVPQVS